MHRTALCKLYWKYGLHRFAREPMWIHFPWPIADEYKTVCDRSWIKTKWPVLRPAPMRVMLRRDPSDLWHALWLENQTSYSVFLVCNCTGFCSEFWDITCQCISPLLVPEFGFWVAPPLYPLHCSHRKAGRCASLLPRRTGPDVAGMLDEGCWSFWNMHRTGCRTWWQLDRIIYIYINYI